MTRPNTAPQMPSPQNGEALIFALCGIIITALVYYIHFR